MLKRRVEHTPIIYKTHTIRITISIGLMVSTPNHRHSLEDMLMQADEALYKAKNSGRNRTVAYGLQERQARG